MKSRYQKGEMQVIYSLATDYQPMRHRATNHLLESFSFNSTYKMPRASDNFLKQGVDDASLEAKGIFLQNPEFFFTFKFLHKGVSRSCKSSLR